MQRRLERRAVVLGAQHQLTWLSWVHAQRIRLRDLQTRRQIGHPGIVPAKHPAVVGHHHVAVVQPKEIVLVGVGPLGRGRPLPVKLTRPALASVHGAPQVDAANEHVLGIVGIHLQTQIPEGLTQVVCAVDGHTKKVGARGFGGHGFP